mgnify:CR=1 FL=1
MKKKKQRKCRNKTNCKHQRPFCPVVNTLDDVKLVYCCCYTTRLLDIKGYKDAVDRLDDAILCLDVFRTNDFWIREAGRVVLETELVVTGEVRLDGGSLQQRLNLLTTTGFLSNVVGCKRARGHVVEQNISEERDRIAKSIKCAHQVVKDILLVVSIGVSQSLGQLMECTVVRCEDRQIGVLVRRSLNQAGGDDGLDENVVVVLVVIEIPDTARSLHDNIGDCPAVFVDADDRAWHGEEGGDDELFDVQFWMEFAMNSFSRYNCTRTRVAESVK